MCENSDRQGGKEMASPIEVTREMIEAGALELVCFDWMECDSRQAAVDVFRAMVSASHTCERSEPGLLPRRISAEQQVPNRLLE